MIPAGYEFKKFSNKCLSDGGSGSDFDDEDEFVFDFNDKSKTNPQTSHMNFNSVSDFGTSFKNNKSYISNENNNNLTYQINNNYYYDEADFLMENLKNAILQKNLEQVKNLMIKNKLDINCKFKTNWTPLMYAVSSGSYKMTEYFIQNGADVNYENESFSVIMCACGCTDPLSNEVDLLKIIELLVSKGVDVNLTDRYSQTPLMYACKTGNWCLIDCLVRLNADINAQDDQEWTSLAHASHRGYIKCVLRLLKLGADPLICTSDYMYPSDLAEKAGFIEVKQVIKRFLRSQKVKKSKSNLSDVYEDEYDIESDDDSLANYSNIPGDKESTDELESFLSMIKLKNLTKLFKVNQIDLKKLLTFNDDDLKNIGILDSYVRELLLCEIKSFHLKNWKSNSLVPVRVDSSLSCTEIIAIMSNLSRHLDFMRSNVKFISAVSNDDKNKLFTDDHLSLKFSSELKQAAENCDNLSTQLNSLVTNVSKNISNENALPIDTVQPTETKKWYEKPMKIAMTATIGVAVSTFIIFKKSSLFFK